MRTDNSAPVSPIRFGLVAKTEINTWRRFFSYMGRFINKLFINLKCMKSQSGKQTDIAQYLKKYRQSDKEVWSVDSI